MGKDADTARSGTNNKTKRDIDEEVICPIKFTMDKRIDLAIYFFFIIYGIVFYIEATKITMGPITDLITAKGLPIFAGISISILGIALAVVRLKTWSSIPGNLLPAEGREDEEGHPSSWIRVFSIILTVLLSLVFLDSLGYLIVTPAFMIAAVWLMGSRNWKILIAFPVSFTILVWYTFSQVLLLNLPLGFLTPFFRSLGLAP